MFIGHYALGLAAKRWAPKASLGTLVAAAIWLDIAWPIFLLLGLEHFRITPGITKMSPFDFYDYPLSHSLVMALAWAALWGLVYLASGKSDNKGAWIIGGLVVSHWILDFIVHNHDLPILPAEVITYGMPHKYGLGLWNAPWAAISLESVLFIGGFWIYLKSTKALDSVGRVALWAFAAVLAAFYVADLLVSPPNNTNLVSLADFAQLLFVAWAYWIDDHRKVSGK